MSERIGTKRLPSTAEPLNPEFHDEFVALCAIYYSGEISEEEWALLQIHMAYCDSCHGLFLEYGQITSDVIPALATVAASEPDSTSPEPVTSLAEAERRLMRGLKSVPVEREPRRDHAPSWRVPAALIAACALGAACLFGVHLMRTKNQTGSLASLPRSVQAEPGTPVSSRSSTTGDPSIEHSQKQISRLEQQLAATDSSLRQAKAAMAAVQRQLETETAARKQLSEQRETLNQQLSTAQTQFDSMRNALASRGVEVNEQASRTAALETRIRELKTALDDRDAALSEKERMLALDKDFLAHDRDIRDVIGARNLYIADIFDTNESGRTAKQFGRIFYTKDRSLIFYGFDLDSQAGRKQNVSFQVWGKGSDRPAPVNLGLFYEDDGQKRWVLRCNDPKMLARLDMVFVTVEPPGGSARPTGKQLLRAYLQVNPNHP